MRAPKGFGKNYFTLAAIQAYASHALVQQCHTRVHTYTLKMDDECDDTQEEEEAEELLSCVHATLPSHAGHCNCYYRRITRNKILENPQQKLFISTHRFSNSVSSLPFFIQPSNLHKKYTKGKQ